MCGGGGGGGGGGEAHIKRDEQKCKARRFVDNKPTE